MFDSLAYEIATQVSEAIEKILRRTKEIRSSDDFLEDDAAMEKLDAVCMQLIAIGEGLKKIDSITDSKFFESHKEVEWKKAMAMRDILSHHYFDLNAEVVFLTCKNKLPALGEALREILAKVG